MTLDPFDIHDAARRSPTGLAVLSDQRSLTYDALVQSADARIGAWRRALGRSTLEGVPVAIVGGSNGDAVTDIVAALQSRAVAVMIHPLSTADERERLFASTGAELLADGANCIERLDVSSTALPLPAGAAAVVSTSGSTGLPKRVVLTRHALAAAAAASRERLEFGATDRWWLSMPSAHVGGLSIVTRCIEASATIVASPAFSSTALRESVETHGVTIASLVPTMLHRALVDLSGWTPPTCLRAVLLGGARAEPRLVVDARRAGYPVLLTWGMTETCSQIATQPLSVARSLDESPLLTETCGPPLAGWTLDVRDGRAFVRGDALAPTRIVAGLEATAGDDGFFDTGDRVELLNGWVRVLGRGSELIICGGENVDPTELEATLREHADVADVLVVGVPDNEWGEVVGALVVWRGAPSIEALEAYARSALASFKRPRRWMTVAAIPRLPGGKVDRRTAAELLRAFPGGLDR